MYGTPSRSEYTHHGNTRRRGAENLFKEIMVGLPWWCSGWESACRCRGHGFEPWSGKIPHAAEQLGPWATTAEPAHLEPVLRNGRGRDSERPVHHDEEWPPLAATGESPRTETKTQHSQKKINEKLKKKKKEIMVKNFLNLRRDMYIQYKKFKGPQLDSTQRRHHQVTL